MRVCDIISLDFETKKNVNVSMWREIAKHIFQHRSEHNNGAVFFEIVFFECYTFSHSTCIRYRSQTRIWWIESNTHTHTHSYIEIRNWMDELDGSDRSLVFLTHTHILSATLSNSSTPKIYTNFSELLIVGHWYSCAFFLLVPLCFNIFTSIHTGEMYWNSKFE